MAKPEIFQSIRRRIGERLYHRLPIYNDAENYIGPGRRGALKILRYAYGCDLNPGGWVHDGGYGIGGDEEDREFWDHVFLETMLELIEQHAFPFGTAWLLRRLARMRAMEYFNEVRECGKSFFTYRESKS